MSDTLPDFSCLIHLLPSLSTPLFYPFNISTPSSMSAGYLVLSQAPQGGWLSGNECLEQVNDDPRQFIIEE